MPSIDEALDYLHANELQHLRSLFTFARQRQPGVKQIAGAEQELADRLNKLAADEAARLEEIEKAAEAARQKVRDEEAAKAQKVLDDAAAAAQGDLPK